MEEANFDMGGGIRYDSDEYRENIAKVDGGPGSGKRPGYGKSKGQVSKTKKSSGKGSASSKAGSGQKSKSSSASSSSNRSKGHTASADECSKAMSNYENTLTSQFRDYMNNRYGQNTHVSDIDSDASQRTITLSDDNGKSFFNVSAYIHNGIGTGEWNEQLGVYQHGATARDVPEFHFEYVGFKEW